MLEKITPMILTYNEAPNIERTLQSLAWASQVLVIDSYSTDGTLAILKQYAQVEVIQREFDSFAGQCNYGLDHIKTAWVLSLDADYICTKELIAEIAVLPSDSMYDGYFVRFKYCVFGKPLSGTLYPSRQVLYRKNNAKYIDDGHGHRVHVVGQARVLSGYIYHDDRKSLTRWLKSQDSYMIIEAKKLLETPATKSNLADRIRKMKVFAPFIVLLYCLLLKKGILDGWPGWYYAFQRMLAEVILSIRLMELESMASNSSTKLPSNAEDSPLSLVIEVNTVDERVR